MHKILEQRVLKDNPVQVSSVTECEAPRGGLPRLTARTEVRTPVAHIRTLCSISLCHGADHEIWIDTGVVQGIGDKSQRPSC